MRDILLSLVFGGKREGEEGEGEGSFYRAGGFRRRGGWWWEGKGGKGGGESRSLFLILV